MSWNKVDVRLSKGSLYNHIFAAKSVHRKQSGYCNDCWTSGKKTIISKVTEAPIKIHLQDAYCGRLLVINNAIQTATEVDEIFGFGT